MRDHIEAVESARVAQEVLDRLPQNDAELDNLIYEGHRLAHNMSWDVVVRKYLLNDLARIAQQRPEPRNYLKAS